MRGVYRCVVCNAFTLDPVHCGRLARFLMSGEDRIRLSKLLSCLLRHCPGEIGLELDGGGWVGLDALVEAIRTRWRRSDYTWVTREHVEAVVALDEKGRFEILGNRIRARYGHSRELPLSIDYPVDPESRVLFHGTSRVFLSHILRMGILPMKRKFVHLSTSIDDACRVGARHGDPVVVVVDVNCLRMSGLEVLVANSSVRLVERVPPSCIAGIRSCD